MQLTLYDDFEPRCSHLYSFRSNFQNFQKIVVKHSTTCTQLSNRIPPIPQPLYQPSNVNYTLSVSRQNARHVRIKSFPLYHGWRSITVHFWLQCSLQLIVGNQTKRSVRGNEFSFGEMSFGPIGKTLLPIRNAKRMRPIQCQPYIWLTAISRNLLRTVRY